jgi:hypothetical protein
MDGDLCRASPLRAVMNQTDRGTSPRQVVWRGERAGVETDLCLCPLTIGVDAAS